MFFKIILLISSLLLFVQCKERQITHLSVPENKIYLGEYSSDEVKYAEFTLINSGDFSFSIDEVVTDCLCTIPEYSNEKIIPGDSVFVKVGYKGKLIGFFDQTAIVKSNNLDKDYLLIIQGKIIE